jgi:hypothetical protein
MLSQISSRQFGEWRAYGDLEPFDGERDDLRAASIVQALYNIHRKKGAKPWKLRDCALPIPGAQDETPQPPQPTTAEQARAQVLSTMKTLMLIYGSKAPKAPKRKGK